MNDPMSGGDTQPIDSEMDSLPLSQSMDEGWGKMLPLHDAFKPHELRKDSTLFGRCDENVDYSFLKLNRTPPVFNGMSKTHFEIRREKSGDHCIVSVVDFSSNGTFVNGVKIGRNKKHVIKNGDEICIAHIKNKAFMFKDCGVSCDDSSFPVEIREKYAIMKQLGKGAMGTVYLAFLRCDDSQRVAIKAIDFAPSPDQKKNIAREIDILRKIDHPCVTSVKEILDLDKTYIVMEVVEGGELFDRVTDTTQKFTEDLAKIYSYQLLLAIKYLHDNNITHRDLKLENVLLTSNIDEPALLKVADFGLSKIVDSATMLKTFCGTPNYLPPEVIDNDGRGYTEKVDIWSAGVIIFTLCCGYQPFSEGQGNFPLKQQIKEGKYFWSESKWKNVSKTAVKFVLSLLQVDVNKRPSAIQALQHPWFKDEEMLKKVADLMPDLQAKTGNGNMRKRPAKNGDLIQRETPTKMAK